MASMKILVIALLGIAMSQAGEITDLVEDCGKLCLHIKQVYGGNSNYKAAFIFYQTHSMID